MAPNLKVTDNYDGTVNISGHCVFTKKPYKIERVKEEQWQAYLNGALVQNAFKGMSKDDREFIISGISPEGWLNTFGPNEED